MQAHKRLPVPSKKIYKLLFYYLQVSTSLAIGL